MMERLSPRRLTWAAVILLVAPIALGGTTLRAQATASGNRAIGQETVATATTTRVTGQTRTQGQVATHASPTGTVTEFTLPTNCGNPGLDNGCDPSGITLGPDGNMWFTLEDGNRIGRINPTTHAMKIFTLPTDCSNPGKSNGCEPTNIVSGPDGNLWFTEAAGNRIGRVTPQGAIIEFTLPTDCGNSTTTGNDSGCVPQDITVGSDNALWFTEEYGNQLGRISASTGNVTEFPVPTTDSSPKGITKGPDNALWFTEENECGGNNIGTKMLPHGAISEYSIPWNCAGPTDITTGSSTTLYFTENAGNAIGRVSTSGLFAQFQVISPESGLQGITKGPDGNIWFAEADAGNLGRLTPGGTMTEYPIPYHGSYPEPIDVTPGVNGGVWFTESGADRIAYITL